MQTISQAAVVEGRSKERENFTLLNQLRAFANLTYEANATLTTAATGVATVAWTSPTIPDNGCWTVQANVTGYATAGGTGAAAYVILVGIESDAGVAVAIGGTSVTVMQRESAAAMDCLFSLSGQTLQVKVQDDGVLTMKWKVHVSIVEVVRDG